MHPDRYGVMGASSFEFRYRYALHAIIYALGFTAPWNYWLHMDPVGPNEHVWGLLALDMPRVGVSGIALAFNILLITAILLATCGAWLRTWGAAYLGGGVVQSGELHTFEGEGRPGVVEAGPYRYVRNPLYLGTLLHTIALTLLMPPSGAIFALAAAGVLQIRLILAEETFLRLRLGAKYLAYCSLVPRLLPAVPARIADSSTTPRWGQAFLTEIYMWGVALSFAVAGWHYSSLLMTQCVVVSLGLSLVVRAVFSGRNPAVRA